MRPKVVLCNGCFDLFHFGHLLHLEAAKGMGDVLVVSVTRDKDINKGDGRPVFNERQRKMMVGALRCVDRVLLVSSSLEALKRVRPDIFVKGQDYNGKIRDEDLIYCERQGIKIAFTDEQQYSSTKLLHYYES